MYCDKLKSIVREDRVDPDVNEIVIQKLDKFIKEKTTIRERRKLNPYRFSIEMQISQKIAIKAFIKGAKCELFSPRFYYSCSCGDQFEVSNLNSEIQCTFEKK